MRIVASDGIVSPELGVARSTLLQPVRFF